MLQGSMAGPSLDSFCVCALTRMSLTRRDLSTFVDRRLRWEDHHGSISPMSAVDKVVERELQS